MNSVVTESEQMAFCFGHHRGVGMSGKQSKSKRNRKRQSQQTLPRLDAVYGNVFENVSSLTVIIDAQGRISIPEIDPASIQRRLTYGREGKTDKVIYAAPATDFTHEASQWAELVQNFDYLMAVDTNTLPERKSGVRISVCSIYCFSNELARLGPSDSAMHVESYLICDASEDSTSHEPLGWHLAISRHTVLEHLLSKRVGLVTDHDLGKHADINAGRATYFDGIALPPEIKLLYASSDKADNFANQLIRLCDSAAKIILDRFSKFQIRQFIYPDPIELGSAFCFRVRVKTTPSINQS